MSTNNLVIGFIDLPDEVLLTIFQKLDNIHLLFSLLGVSPKLDKIVCDITCTQSIDLSTLLPNDANDSRNNAILDRFYTRILPRIHNNVESFIVHASSLQHILRASYYPNLRKLTLVNLAIDMVPRFFNSMLFDFRSGENSSFICCYKSQLLHLVVTISDVIWKKSMETIVAQTYVGIFTWLSKLQYLDLDGNESNPFRRRLLYGLSPVECSSSCIAHLRIKIHNFDDCLCLLDGRLRQLQTLIVKLDYVRNATISINNENTLVKLKCFSLYVRHALVDFDNTVVPLLRRMSNMENLTLSFRVRRRTSYIDGIYLTNEVFKYMPHLHTFMCDIVSDETIINQHIKPSPDDIRQTFIQNGYQVDCYIDEYTEEMGRCHVYSVPFSMDHMHYITSRFPGGMFANVFVLLVRDISRAFEHSFFVKIARSFPLLNELAVLNTTEQLGRSMRQLNKLIQASSVIEYPHLAELDLTYAHIDYVEQFLSSMNTRLPCLSKLRIRYEHLITVTDNFTRDSTRINCAKLKDIIFDKPMYSVQSRDFYLYFPSL